MSAPYICKKCGKEMWSLNDVVEYWDDIYCKRCAKNPIVDHRPVKTKPMPVKSDIADEKCPEDSIRENKEAVHIKDQRNEIAFYKKGDVIEGKHRKHEVCDILGMGGFGIVYLVFDGYEFNALKTLHDEYLRNSPTRDRFCKEAQIWLKFDKHPYIVHASDIEIEKNTEKLFIELEYISPDKHGLNSLEKHLRYQPPDLAQSLRWAIQFCHGMEYAYSKGIKAHRDIKPANIMITHDKTLKISDFGLAGVIGESKVASGIKIDIRQGSVGFSCQTMEGVGFGTPTHMPPEQFTNAAGCDERSDIYSFGVVLYQMATGGKLPFLATLPRNDEYEESRRFWVEMHKLHRQASIPKIDMPFSAIIRHCLEKAQKNRYPFFKELRKDLEAILKQNYGQVVQIQGIPELTLSELLIKGDCLDKLGKLQDSISYFDRAAKIEQKCGFVWIKKGSALFNHGKYQEAITCYVHALKINTTDEQAWYGKALAEDEIGRGQDAAFSYKRFIELASAQYKEQIEYARQRLKELEGK